MKKNILTFIVLVLCLANITLTSILMFAMLPSFQKTNRLITQVSQIMDLELGKGDSQDTVEQSYNVEDLVPLKLEFTEKQTINLMKDGGSESSYALLDYITVSLNKKSKDYKKVEKLITDNDILVKNKVRSLIQTYTIKNINENEICGRAEKELNELYKTDCIILVTLEGFTYN